MSRVLIVEDDVDVRDWIAHCMLQDGDELRGVTDGRRLRALHDDEPDYRPDLVLMDYALPDTDGVALLAELHGFWPDVPAVFVTVQWTGEVIERIARHRLRTHRQAVQPRRPARRRAPGAREAGEPGVTRVRLLDLGAFAGYFVLAAYLGRQAVVPGSGLALVWPAAGVAAAWLAVTGWQRGSSSTRPASSSCLGGLRR